MSRLRIPRWVKILGIAVAILLVAFLALLTGLGWYVKNQMLDSGGRLAPAMAAYDIRHYDLAVRVDPENRRIEGSNTITALTLGELQNFEIHLDDRLEVKMTEVDGVGCSFRHSDGVIVVQLPVPWAIGDRHDIKIRYEGEPKVALRPPWVDGFVWSETPTGMPWIGVTGQGDGGDNWWPCKDHPSDEPDEGMDITLTVPAGLVGLTNGRLMNRAENDDDTVTTNWRVHYPINNYLVTVNIAPYVAIEERYHGIDGTLDVPLVFWSTPESEQHAGFMWRQMPRVLEVLGSYFGEYPFFEDKFAVVHAPYYGMEHQTIVAYGALFTDNHYGFDDLLLHEVAHEWWGNKITVEDWSDFWIQEGFATYAESLYVHHTLGEDRYLDYMRDMLPRITNDLPLVQGKDLTSAQAYIGDIYFKGAWVLHSLRWVIGEEALLKALFRFANDPEFAYGLVSSQDFIDLVAEISGQELDWFWERYLFRAEVPTWRMKRRVEGDRELVQITWDDRSFEMPLPVTVAGEELRLQMSGGRGKLLVEPGAIVEIDARGRILAEPLS